VREFVAGGPWEFRVFRTSIGGRRRYPITNSSYTYRMKPSLLAPFYQVLNEAHEKFFASIEYT
jgi:hypothetical protein